MSVHTYVSVRCGEKQGAITYLDDLAPRRRVQGDACLFGLKSQRRSAVCMKNVADKLFVLSLYEQMSRAALATPAAWLEMGKLVRSFVIFVADPVCFITAAGCYNILKTYSRCTFIAQVNLVLYVGSPVGHAGMMIPQHLLILWHKGEIHGFKRMNPGCD